MEKDRIIDVDMETFSEINRDQEDMEKSLESFVPKQKDPNWFSNHFKNSVCAKADKNENYLSASNSLSGIKNTHSKPAEQPARNSSTGIAGWLQKNPLAATITGLALAAGAFALFRHLKREDKEISTTRRKPKRKSTAFIENEDSKNPKESIRKEEIHKEEYKELTQEAIIVAGASALGGTIAGAALGDISLLASVPVAIMGFKKRNLNVAMASIGMALANGYRSINNNGNFIQKAVKRIIVFTENIFSKIFLWNKEEGERQGYYKTILGYIPIRQIA